MLEKLTFDINDILNEYFENLFRKIELIGCNEELSDYTEVMEYIDKAKVLCNEHGATETIRVFDDLIETHEIAKKEYAADIMVEFEEILSDMEQNVTKGDIMLLLETYGYIAYINVPEKTKMESEYVKRFNRLLADDYAYFFTNGKKICWEI